MDRRHALIPAIFLLCASPVVVAAKDGKGEARALLKTVQSAAPALERAVTVRKAEIKMGLATLVIDEGVLLPAQPLNGHTLELAFVGDAWFRLATTDPVEGQQLELFTGGRSMLTQITHAVLVSGNDATFQQLLAGEPTQGDKVKEAAAFFKTWVEGPERQGFAADLSMVKTLRGDPLYDGYFAAWCRSEDHGDFYYVVDPSLMEPYSLGQFVPWDMSQFDVWEQRSIKSFIRSVKFFGRFADFSAEHPGDWDTWLSTRHKTDAITPPEPEHYIIDLYTNPHIELDAKGTARIRLRGGSKPARSIKFVLTAGVRVTGVFGPSDVILDYVRRESALHVFLDEPLQPDGKLEIRVDYEGDLVEPLYKSYALRDTQSWYPTTGQIDRATYDVTLRRPKRFGIIGSGRQVAQGVERDMAWERRTLDLPAIGFTFEVGFFEIVTDRVGHVELTFGFQGGVEEVPQEDRTRVIETVKKSLAYFEETFGPYPLDYLNVATVDRGFSQGYLSMVTLAHGAIDGPGGEKGPERWLQRIEEQAVLTIAHEVSHQWWGNWVGWASYRDQWLSEGLASYVALLYGARTAESAPAFLARNALDWRDSLLDTIADGRTVSSLGSVTLGPRLNSSKANYASIPIVYDKGSLVFRMLARLCGEEKFIKMLGTLSQAVSNRVIDTDTFISALERMSGMDLDPFVGQFIHGTGIPDVYFSYMIEPDKEEGKWVIRGKARQIASRVETYKVASDSEGRWGIAREVKVDLDVPTSTFVVPFQVIVTPPAEVRKGLKGTVQRAPGFGGRIVLKGQETPFQFTVPKKPERFELDQLGEVLALFHDEEWAPKHTLRLQATDLEATGDSAGAEALLRRALDAPLYSERARAWLESGKERSAKEQKEAEENEEKRETFENARIRTLLARFLLDRGDLDAAEKEIVAAESLLEKPDAQADWSGRQILRSRIELARGNPEAAYLRLRKGRFKWWLGAEGNALLAVAASETGHERMAREAMQNAEAEGVDMRALRQLESLAR